MKKIVFFLLIASILTVGAGCSRGLQNESEESYEVVVLAETAVPENAVTEATETENTVSENIVILDISEDDIVNRDGVLDDFWTGYQDAAGKITVDSYNDQFPGELQDLLIACNDDTESDIDWEKYAADYDIQLRMRRSQ